MSQEDLTSIEVAALTKRWFPVTLWIAAIPAALAGLLFGSLIAPGLTRNAAAPSDPVQQIAAGWGHTCALVSSGKVYCWGVAKVNGADRNTTSPLLVSGLGEVKAISAGLIATCAIDVTDHALCWGTDWEQTAERKELVKSHTPKLIEGLPTVAQIAIGYAHVCAILKGDGSVWCWGGNGVGELGDGTTVERQTPAQATRAGTITGASWISAGVGNTCAVVGNGEVYCWGSDRQRGGGTIVKSTTPIKVNGLNNVIKVVNGRNFFCTLTARGEVICFGSNIFTQLGNKKVGQRYATLVRSKVPVATDIAANLFTACAALKSRKVSCWGSPLLEAKEWKTGVEPTEIVDLDNVKSVALGLTYACALLYSGQIKCWGAEIPGTGQSSNVPVIRPTEVRGLP